MQRFYKLSPEQRDKLLELTAEHCHEANRHFKESIGEFGPCWRVLKSHQKRAAIEGVRFYVNESDNGACQSHEAWCMGMKEAGWTAGDCCDYGEKTHPGLVDFEALPEAQRTKSHLHRSMALAFIAQRLSLLQ